METSQIRVELSIGSNLAVVRKLHALAEPEPGESYKIGLVRVGITNAESKRRCAGIHVGTCRIYPGLQCGRGGRRHRVSHGERNIAVLAEVVACGRVLLEMTCV